MVHFLLGKLIWEIEFKIQEGIAEFFPQVNIEQLILAQTPDRNKINITVTYSIPQLGVNDSIEIALV